MVGKMRTLGCAAIAAAVLVSACEASYWEWTPYTDVPSSEANHNAKLGIMHDGPARYFIYASGENLYRAEVKGGLTSGDWANTGSGLTYGDPQYIAVNPADNTTMWWGDGGSVGGNHPNRLVTGLDGAAASFGPSVVSLHDSYNAVWRNGSEAFVQAKTAIASDGTACDDAVFRVYESGGTWTAQQVVSLGNVYSGGMDISADGDLYVADGLNSHIYRLTQAELDAAIAGGSPITIPAGAGPGDAHYVTNLGCSGSIAVTPSYLVASGWQFDDTIWSYRLADGATTAHTVSGVSAPFVEFALVADGEDVFALRRPSWYSFPSTVEIYGAVAPEPATAVAVAFGCAWLAGVRRKRRRTS
jgi:hypothetical protein